MSDIYLAWWLRQFMEVKIGRDLFTPSPVDKQCCRIVLARSGSATNDDIQLYHFARAQAAAKEVYRKIPRWDRILSYLLR